MFKIGNYRKKKVSNFSDLLPEILQEFDIEKDLYLENIIEIWNTIVSQTLADHSIPDRIFKKTLFIAVDHSIFANEISVMTNTIIERINKEIPSKGIVNIKCEIKKLKWNK